MNVLVIEDNLFDFCILEEMLKKSGDPSIRLVHCQQLSDGFRRLEQEPFDLILLDLNLPGSNGLETFEAAYRNAPQIPIIVLSAMDASDVAVQAVKGGAQDYLVKGKVNTDLLVRAMRYALERKHLNEKLRVSEERYRIISDLISDYAWCLRVEEGGRLGFDWVTGPFQQLAGARIEEMDLKTGWKKLVHPGELPDVQEHIRSVNAGQPGSVEFRCKTQGGSYHWVRHYSRPEVDEKTGRVVRVYGAGKDITERKQMESNLRDADDRYHSIFDGVNDAILVESRKGRILDANESACRLYGYTREELLSRHVSDLVPREYILVLAADTAELKSKVPDRPIEAINVRANGEYFPVEMSISAYRIGSETVSLVVVRDIWERKQAEEAYRTLVDRSLQELYIIQDDHVVFANPAALSNTGYSLDELQKFSSADILSGIYDDEAGNRQASVESRRAGRATPSRREFRRTHKDGTTGWATALITGMQYQGAPATQVALIDVTERIQAEEAYRTLVEQSLQELLILQDGWIVFANPAAVQNSGYSQRDLLSLPADDLLQKMIHPQDLPQIREAERAILAGELPSARQEIQVVNQDGSLRWVETLRTRIEYQGRPAIQTVQFDITERKRAEERLRYRHDIEALITSVSTRFINLTSDRIDSGIQQALQSLGKFTGMDRSYIYLLSSDWTRFIDGYEWCAEGIKSSKARLVGESFEPFRWTLDRYKGREAVAVAHIDDLPVEAQAEKARWKSEKIQSVLGIPLILNNMLFGFWGFDSVRSEKTWAEEDIRLLRMMGDVFVNALARKQTEQALRKARQELDQVVNSVSDALWTAEVDCQTGELEHRYMSPVMERITGRSPEFFKPSRNPWYSIIHPEDRERVRESYDRLWKERVSSVEEEYRILLPDGGLRWVRDSQTSSDVTAGRIRLDAVLSDITERKQAEEAYRTLVEQSLQELLIFRDGCIVFANPAAVRNSGYTLDELLSLSAEDVHQMIYPEDRADVRRATADRLAGKPTPERQEYRVLRKDGSMRWLESLSIRIEYQGGAAIQSAQLDITMRKEAEERLRHRVAIEELVSSLSTRFINLSTAEVDSQIEAALQSIGEFTGVDRCYLDLISSSGWRIARGYEWCARGILPNPEMNGEFDLEPFGWTMERLKRFETVYVPHLDDLPPEAAFEQSFWKGIGRKSILDIPLVLNDALTGYFGFTTERAEKEWAEEDIRLLQLMGDVFVNVLARKKAEEALIESEAQYRLLADSISDVVGLHDLDGRFLYLSPSVEWVTGWTPRELYGAEALEFIDSNEQGVLDDIDEAIKQGEDRQLQWRCKCKNGESIWIETNLQIILKDDQPHRLLSTSRDITGRKQAEQDVYEANQRLQQSVVEMEQRNHEVTLLNELGDLLQGCLNLNDVYDVVASLALKLFPRTRGGLFTLNASKKLVEMTKTWGGSISSDLVFAPDQCWALRRCRVHAVNFPVPDLHCGHTHIAENLAYICIPMIAHGETLGLFFIESDAPEPDLRCRSLAIMVAERVALAMANLRLRETLQRQSIRDSLTGLFNRRYMETTVERELRQAKRQQQSVGFIMIDMDRFKQFNDTYGHGAGDTLLAALGEYLQGSIRGGDIACRYGGDEFVLILPQATLADTQERAEELREGLKRITIEYRGMLLGPVTASLGVSAYPDHAESMDPLLSLADSALYHAKDGGRDRVSIAEMMQEEKRIRL